MNENEERRLIEAIKSARTVQDFLWGNNNPDWDFEEWKAMFQKRWTKISNINPDNPHAITELKKRLLQNAALCIALLDILDKKDITLKTNLPEYRGIQYDI